MNNAELSILYAFLAGMATLVGALSVFGAGKKTGKLISVSLGFAAGVMLVATFSDLMPEAEERLSAGLGEKMGALLAIALTFAGILLSALLEKLLPHRHTHSHEHCQNCAESDRNLLRAGTLSALAIALHNFPEGVALFMAGYEDAVLGASFMLAVALHNLPVGITVALPIYIGTGSRGKALLYTLLVGLAEPLGAVLAYLLLRPLMSDLLLGTLFSLSSGILLYVALDELIPSSREYGYPHLALFATFMGVGAMLLTHLL